MDLRFVYITTNDRDQARAIGRALVEERLVACVNIIDGMNSLYWWQGAIQDDHEAIVIAKTRAELVPKLIDRVKALHRYDVPCIVALPILSGNPDFLRWIEEETK
jgi:periplasmic divalent cation tolerance protein